LCSTFILILFSLFPFSEKREKTHCHLFQK